MNPFTISERSKMKLPSAPESVPNAFFLPQERYGLVDDLKAVTSGSWLKEQSFLQSSMTAAATVLVYLDAALASNVSQSGKVMLLVVLIVSAGLLSIANESTNTLFMHGCKVDVDGPRKRYGRRLHMVDELLQEDDRVDWAMKMALWRLGMTVEKGNDQTSSRDPSGTI